ncbi:MAG TPA: hypothetical protein H9902_00335 [Candidatus Stackebrandtia faecavium]|nr:hypothetical protein [Candidatus Stackebrandtia faecavium]
MSTKSVSDSTGDKATQDKPMNRAERRAMKKNKGHNEVKGVGGPARRNGFKPKDMKVAGHKEFTNRKNG